MLHHKISGEGSLLDEKGQVREAGYSTSLPFIYGREQIKASSIRIKEWDYYYIGNNDFGIALVIADNSYMGLASASFIDFNNQQDYTDYALTLFPMGRMNLPKSSISGDVGYKNKKIDMTFYNNGINRRLYCNMPKFDKGKGLFIDIILSTPKDSMVIVTPYKEDKRAFYYNQKINCMLVNGEMKFNGKECNLNNHLAVLDWGRGVWTYDNTWYWGSLSTILPDNKLFGFNIGYGFGDTSAASENMLFYEGIAHKIDQVSFNIPVNNGKEKYMDDWTFTSSDNRLNMTFKPIFDRITNLNLLLIGQDAHQVFGSFSGSAILDDGSIIEFNDCVGFAEKVRNKW